MFGGERRACHYELNAPSSLVSWQHNIKYSISSSPSASYPSLHFSHTSVYIVSHLDATTFFCRHQIPEPFTMLHYIFTYYGFHPKFLTFQVSYPSTLTCSRGYTSRDACELSPGTSGSATAAQYMNLPQARLGYIFCHTRPLFFFLILSCITFSISSQHFYNFFLIPYLFLVIPRLFFFAQLVARATSISSHTYPHLI